MSNSKRVFTVEFKRKCVNLVLNQGYSVVRTSRLGWIAWNY